MMDKRCRSIHLTYDKNADGQTGHPQKAFDALIETGNWTE